MNDDTIRDDTPDDDDRERDGFGGVSLIDNKLVIASLGGLCALAVVLVLVRRATARAGRTVASSPVAPGIVEGDWEASLEHLAAALDFRLGALEIRIDEIVNDRIVAKAAAVSMPVTPLITGDNEHDNDEPEIRPSAMVAGVSDLEPATPPAPAAVSAPPETIDADARG